VKPLSFVAGLCLLAAGCKTPAPLPPQAVELNRMGAIAFSMGDGETAEARFALAIEYHDRFTEAWVNLGLVELSRGNFVLAKKDFEKARDLNEKLPTPHHALGLLADKRGQDRIAEHHYKAALKADPGFAPARVNLGRLYFRWGAFDDAREQFERLTQVAPDEIAGWTGLTESLLRLGREDDADDTLGRARSRLGDAPELVFLVARQLIRRSAFTDAEGALTPLTGEGDARRRSAAWSWIAIARVGAGLNRWALDAAREALLADHDDPLAQHALRLALSGARAPPAQ
jgi:tetratricopeptide (TPR) repeat protein